ncbi:MAG: hypothetical protein HYT69_00640 [Candidatus Zambryskibacteria bacterium]|nr:hypothetical protein [Candidatus Zambryskibacteria bacterium]
MKVIIWIIIIALVAWGIWAWTRNGSEPVGGQEAQVGGALDDLNQSSEDTQDSGDDIDTSEFEDKG